MLWRFLLLVLQVQAKLLWFIGKFVTLKSFSQREIQLNSIKFTYKIDLWIKNFLMIMFKLLAQNFIKRLSVCSWARFFFRSSAGVNAIQNEWCSRFTHSNFNSSEKQTTTLDIWSCSGQLRYNSVLDQFIEKSKIIVICFDLTSNSSFEELHYWHDRVKTLSIPCCILESPRLTQHIDYLLLTLPVNSVGPDAKIVLAGLKVKLQFYSSPT